MKPESSIQVTYVGVDMSYEISPTSCDDPDEKADSVPSLLWTFVGPD